MFYSENWCRCSLFQYASSSSGPLNNPYFWTFHDNSCKWFLPPIHLNHGPHECVPLNHIYPGQDSWTHHTSSCPGLLFVSQQMFHLYSSFNLHLKRFKLQDLQSFFKQMNGFHVTSSFLKKNYIFFPPKYHTFSEVPQIE